jgi:hypothetical protein
MERVLMLNITCDACHKPLEEMGALLFSPPDQTIPYPNMNTTKFHLCVHCYAKVLELVFAPTPLPFDHFVNKIEKRVEPEVKYKLCPSCNGRGKRMQFGGVFYNETCRNCNGEGRIPT